MRLLPGSIRHRLLLFLAFALLPVAGLIILAATEIQKLEQQHIEQEVLILAGQSAHEHRLFISETRRLLSDIGEVLTLQNPALPTCGELLRRLLRRHTNYTNLGIVAPHGNVLCSAIASKEPGSAENQPFFRDAVSTRSFTLSSSAISGNPEKSEITASLPVYDDAQNILGVIYAPIQPKSLSALSRLPVNSTITMLDTQGNSLVQYPDREKLSGKPSHNFKSTLKTLRQNPHAIFNISDSDGIDRLSVFVPILELSETDNIYIRIAVPVAALHTHDHELIERIVLIFFIILIFFALSSIGIDRFVIRGIDVLASELKKKGPGALQQAPSIAEESTEIMALARGMDDMSTELKHALNDLETQRTVLNEHAIVSIADRGGRITYVNDKFRQISQYSREELLGQDHRLINSGYHPPAFFLDLWHTIGSGHIWSGEIKNRAKDGSFYWVKTTIAPILDLNGKIHHYLSIRTDITRLVEIQEELLKNEKDLEKNILARTMNLMHVKDQLELDIAERMRVEQALQLSLKEQQEILKQRQSILDALPANIALLNPQGDVIGYNQAWQRFAQANDWGAVEPGIGYNYVDLCVNAHGESSAEAANAAAGLRKILDGDISIFELEYPCHGPDEKRWFKLLASPLASDAQLGAVVMHIDISERVFSEQNIQSNYIELKQLHHDLQTTQVQLLQREKLSAIGQLAAGVAHEINTPIGYIRSNLDSVNRDLFDILRLMDAYEKAEHSLPGDERKALHEIRNVLQIEATRRDLLVAVTESIEGVTRVQEIVRTLRDFSHVDTQEWQLADLHREINNALKVTENELKYKATVVKDYGTIPPVQCIPSQINQVFLNLLLNACHAIEVYGTITIRTGVENNTVWIEILDTGRGMSESTLSRIFEPFFTTKEVGEGTGLGMSLSYNIIQKHHGEITVESQVGSGTGFRIMLPMHQPEIPNSSEPPVRS